MSYINKLIFFLFFSSFYFITTFATKLEVVCNGLPGCEKQSSLGEKTTLGTKTFFTFLGNIISEGIKYVAVISVFSLMLAGVIYITSLGADEKHEKAKKWIIYSIVGVVISITSWMIINMLNSFKIS